MPEKDRLYRAEAIILKRMNLGEADRILTLYTHKYGKIRAIAKGVRRPTSRKRGHVELFMRSRLLLAQGRSLDIITQAEVIDAYMPLRRDLWRTTYACYAAELLDHFTPEEESSPALFNLLQDVLKWIGGETDLDRLMRYYELRLLDLVGFRPQLFDCVRCHTEIKPERNYFSYNQGGIVCPQCAQAQSKLRPLALQPLKVLRFFQTHHYDACRSIRISTSTHYEAEDVMHHYIAYHLERQLKSTDFMRLLRGLEDQQACAT
jgi:DNA repair protein RecO (recombination protein O)